MSKTRTFEARRRQRAAGQLNWALYIALGAKQNLRSLPYNQLSFIHDPKRDRIQRRVNSILIELEKLELELRKQSHESK